MSKFYKNKEELIGKLINKDDVVLDVGFWGQGISINDENWVHRLLQKATRHVYGLDLDFDGTRLNSVEKYKKGSAEDFDFGLKFDVIFAGDLIEHLSNPGLFLQSCRRNLKPDGVLIITTPSCFNLFNLSEKLSKREPTVNHDHTCYFNSKTLSKLLEKNQFGIEGISYLYSPGTKFKESYKKKFLNVVYYLLSKYTDKFLETLVIVA